MHYHDIVEQYFICKTKTKRKLHFSPFLQRTLSGTVFDLMNPAIINFGLKNGYHRKTNTTATM